MVKLSVNDRRFLNRITKEQIGKLLFIAAFLMLLIVDYVSATGVRILFSGRVFQLAILLMGVKILLTHYSRIEWVLLGLGGVLSVISFLHTRNYFVCMLIMLLMASKDVSARFLMWLYTVIVLVITTLTAVLAVAGVRGDVFLVQDFRGNGLETRYCMGFTHPNTFHIVCIQLMLSFIWLYWKKLKWYYFVILFGINLLITYFTDSRTNLLIGSAVLIAYLLLKVWPRISRWIGIYLAGFGVLVLSLLLSVVASVYGDATPFLIKLDELWTHRIRLSYWMRFQSKVTMFSGEEFQVNCDMGFVNTVYNYGIVIVLLVIGIIIWKLFEITKRRDYVVLVGVVACLIFYLGERFSSGEFITRNLMFVYMLGWGTYESDKPEKQST